MFNFILSHIMAKAKTGGSRAYIRGKLGADVYSIGKDGKGKKQQVVRSLAEQVSNPQTEAQMQGRMIMSTVMQAQSAMAQIIDHSFDGVPAGQPSISEFIRTNYALIKTDVAAHPSSGNSFAVNKYQEKGVLGGAFQLAKGLATIPSGVSVVMDEGVFYFKITKEATVTTAGAVRALLGLAVNDYFTVCRIEERKIFAFLRIKVTDTLPDSTTLTSGNVADLFDFEGNLPDEPVVTLSSTAIQIDWRQVRACRAGGLIVSKKQGSEWQHNNAVLTVDSTITLQPAATALPTYPVGASRFLNGGEL